MATKSKKDVDINYNEIEYTAEDENNMNNSKDNICLFRAHLPSPRLRRTSPCAASRAAGGCPPAKESCARSCLRCFQSPNEGL